MPVCLFLLTGSCGGGAAGTLGFFNGLGGEIEGCNGATAVNPKKSFDVEQKGDKAKRNATDGFNVRTIPILC